MSTRGSLQVKGKTYYMRSDSYPSHAGPILERAAHSKNPVATANRLAGFKWLTQIKGKEAKQWMRDTVFREHGWKIKNKRVSHRESKPKPSSYSVNPFSWGR